MRPGRELRKGWLRELRRHLRQVRRPASVPAPTRRRDWGQLFVKTLIHAAGAAVPSVFAWIDWGDPARRFAWSYLGFLSVNLFVLRLRWCWEQDPDLVPLALLPVSEESVAVRQFHRGLRALAWPTAMVVIGWGIASFPLGTGLGTWLGVSLAFALLFPALAIALTLWSYQLRFLRLGLAWAPLLTVPALIALKWSPRLAASTRQLLETHGDALAACLPTGWLLLPAHARLVGGSPWLYAPLVPALMLLGSLPSAWTWFRDRYRFREGVLLDQFGELPAEADEALVEAVSEAQTQPSGRGETAVVDDLLSGNFLEPRLPCPEEWIEAQVWRWWTPRQRLVAEYLQCEWPDWTQNLRVSLGFIAAALVLGGTLKAMGSPYWHFAYLGGGAAAGLLLLPFGNGFHSGLLGAHCGSLRLSPWLWQPVSSEEIIGTLWKATALRTAVAFPIWTAAATTAGWLAGIDLWIGATLGAQTALVPLAFYPLTLVGQFRRSLSSFRSSPAGWLTGGILVLTVVGVILSVAASLVPGWGWLAVAAMAAVSWLPLWMTVKLVNHGRLDALTQAPTTAP
jgi:hypothetical protein